jgi:DNA-binding transcriptional MerR regulator/mannose-6-phosphate isomerase-like protein (cupin superfamily)
LKTRAQHGSLQSRPAPDAGSKGYLKIGDVAKLTGVSASVIRSWERLGIIRPVRTDSQYRLYSKDDLKVLKRARFLSRIRGLNGPAIVELLKAQGMVQATRHNGSGSMGLRLRQLRLSRKLSLAEVAGSVGISVSFLSAIERSHMSASVGTSRKLARYYKLNILDFFDPTQANPFRVRPSERKRLDVGPGVQMDLLAWGNTVMEPHLFTIAPGAESGDAYAHEGEEFLYVLRGVLNIALEGQWYLLHPGDSFYFESSTPHTWRNTGKAETVLLWVNTPPTF